MKRLASVAVVSLIVAACSLDATKAADPSTGPVGGIGSSCKCSAGQTECDATNGGCEVGLICTAEDVTSTAQFCTQPCPCPVRFVCKAAGQIGGRYLCFKE